MSNDDRAEKAAERTFGALQSKVSQLGAWFANNRPTVDTIRITRDDYNLLRKFPAIASTKEFRIEGEQVKFRGFTILPNVGAPNG